MVLDEHRPEAQCEADDKYPDTVFEPCPPDDTRENERGGTEQHADAADKGTGPFPRAFTVASPHSAPNIHDAGDDKGNADSREGKTHAEIELQGRAEEPQKKPARHDDQHEDYKAYAELEQGPHLLLFSLPASRKMSPTEQNQLYQMYPTESGWVKSSPATQ